jgi:hypothetical protein
MLSDDSVQFALRGQRLKPESRPYRTVPVRQGNVLGAVDRRRPDDGAAAWYPALPAHVIPARCDEQGEVNFDAFFHASGRSRATMLRRA